MCERPAADPYVGSPSGRSAREGTRSDPADPEMDSILSWAVGVQGVGTKHVLKLHGRGTGSQAALTLTGQRRARATAVPLTAFVAGSFGGGLCKAPFRARHGGGNRRICTCNRPKCETPASHRRPRGQLRGRYNEPRARATPAHCSLKRC